MIGGEDPVSKHLDPISRPLRRARIARAHAVTHRTDGTAQHGYLHCGPSGAGHYVKMVHNGIEYA